MVLPLVFVKIIFCRHMKPTHIFQAAAFAAMLSMYVASHAAMPAEPQGQAAVADGNPAPLRTFREAQAASLASIPRASLWNYEENYGAGAMTVHAQPRSVSRTGKPVGN